MNRRSFFAFIFAAPVAAAAAGRQPKAVPLAPAVAPPAVQHFQHIVLEGEASMCVTRDELRKWAVEVEKEIRRKMPVLMRQHNERYGA